MDAADVIYQNDLLKKETLKDFTFYLQALTGGTSTSVGATQIVGGGDFNPYTKIHKYKDIDMKHFQELAFDKMASMLDSKGFESTFIGTQNYGYKTYDGYWNSSSKEMNKDFKRNIKMLKKQILVNFKNTSKRALDIPKLMDIILHVIFLK